MRRSRLPSDSPSIVTRPGVNRTSIELCVISIQDGIPSGRQSTNNGGGRLAFASCSCHAISLATVGVHGVGFDLIWASWSLVIGTQMPLQSGSLDIASQSFSVGDGIKSFFWAGCAE